MSDTLVEPPPPTEPDFDPAAVAPAPPRRRGRGCAIAAVVSTLVAIVGAAAYVYLFVWRYVPHAREHIPDGTVFAARMEATEVLLFPPVRKHLWALLTAPEPEGPKPAPKAGPSRIERIRKATGFDPVTDLREVVVVATDPASWALVLGGRIPRGRFVAGLVAALHEAGDAGWAVHDGLAVSPGGMTVGQADDGVVVVASNGAIARAALPAADGAERVQLPPSGAVVFALTEEGWKAISSTLGAMPRSDALRRVRHGSGVLHLGDAPSLEVSLRPADAVQLVDVEQDLGALLGGLRLATLLLPDRYGEKEALSQAKVAAEGQVVVLRAPWPIDGMDRACADLAKLADVLR